eukprot:13630-Heterococcus_DN1.PRE.2
MLTSVIVSVVAVVVEPLIGAKEMSLKHITDTMLTAKSKVVATTLHITHFDSSSDINMTSDSGSMSTGTGTHYDNSNSSTSIENNAGIGPILDMTSYNRFEAALARLQVHASDVVRVDDQAIGTGVFW